jgi:hypothetical protein
MAAAAVLPKPRIHTLLDLREVPAQEHWGRILGAAEQLNEERGRGWRMKVLLPDTPDAAGDLPHLVARLTRAGLSHDSTREPDGAQGMIVTPHSDDLANLLGAARDEAIGG